MRICATKGGEINKWVTNIREFYMGKFTVTQIYKHKSNIARGLAVMKGADNYNG